MDETDEKVEATLHARILIKYITTDVLYTGQYSQSDDIVFSHQKCNVKFKHFSGVMLPSPFLY